MDNKKEMIKPYLCIEQKQSVMKRFLILIFVGFHIASASAQTLEECQSAAISNYPVIKRYDLISQTTDFTVSNIQKGWLPQISAVAQATYQSDVTSWPDEMRAMLSQTGVDIRGLKKDQYRVGVDINQTVYDGGRIKTQKEMAFLQGDVDRAQADVDIYAVRKRVNYLYFSALMVDEQIRLAENMLGYMLSYEEKLESMYANGTASLSDYNMIKAERLSVEQQITGLEAQRSTLQYILETFCGMPVTKLVKPPVASVGNENSRPELRYVDSQLRLLDMREKMLDTELLPLVSVFASGFYGYPGYNMFEDMMHHKWSLNGMVGMKVTWNIGALYTRKSDLSKLNLQRSYAENMRETFLFNNNMEQQQIRGNMERYSKILSADDEIIALRTSVRKASESRLSHGIIDVSELVKDIKTEHDAMVQKSIHEIELLKEMSELKYAVNG